MKLGVKECLLFIIILIVILGVIYGGGCDCGGDDDDDDDDEPSAAGGDQADTDVADVTYAEEPVNTDPVISGIEDLTMTEDSAAQTIDLSGKCTDADGDAVTWSTLDVDEAILDVALAGTTVSVTPKPNAYGTTGFTMVCTDTYDAQASQAVTITIEAVNEAPVITSSPAVEVFVGQQYSYAVTATDVDNHELVYTISGNPESMTIDGSGIISWIPSEPGVYDITVTVTDAAGLIATQDFKVIAVEP